MTKIAKTAVIERGAHLDDDVRVGDYSIIGSRVRLGKGVCVHSHVVITGNTQIGEGSAVYPFASLGGKPQDLKYRGEDSTLVIGRNVTIREHVTAHPGTKGGGMETRIGDNCLVMIGCHIAHDCVLGKHVIMANGAALAGHVVVGDYAVLGGMSAVHQYVRIGKYSMIAGLSGVGKDVVPYGFVMGYPAGLCALNLVGLRRHGFKQDAIFALRKAFGALFKGGVPPKQASAEVAKQYADNPLVMDVIAFMQDTKRGVCDYTTQRYGVRDDDGA
ncbi:MAG: acyl-ACP--UDP-N-acetylglucosamine O-acyltransferase [Alphaproteobacteria bacterium GM202ARS2]|nr:acyl-ACP--UDP-N-acetylglucosamine O-acyltransferase [Alphaproteobacteria bacterium GM202ARS2]